MKKYTILTFIVGKNYEILREIQNKQDDVEYICVTDDEELKSDTWKVVFDKDLQQFNSNFQRCFYIRYNPFKYATIDTVVTIDGSIEVKGSLDKLVLEFIRGKYDISLMPHPLRNQIIPELNEWIRLRSYPFQMAQNQLDYFARNNYDFNYRGLFQLCYLLRKNTQLTNEINKRVYDAILEVSNSIGTYDRLDQTIFSYILNSYYNKLKVLPVSEQIIRSYAMQYYWHASNVKNCNAFYDINRPDMKYVFNNLTETFYLK